MKKLLAIIGLISALGQSAFAQSESINIWAAGDSTPAAVTLDFMGYDSSGNSEFGFVNQNVPETFTVNGQAETINLTTLVFDSDPSVRFAFGVNNPDGATGSTAYSFTFTTPVALAAGAYDVSSSIAGSLTKGIDGDTAPVVLSLPSTGGDVMQAFVGSQDAGVDQIGSAISVSPSEGNSQSFPSNYSTPVTPYTLSSDATQISVTTAFQLSGSDSASFTGRFDINTANAVPEPGSVGLGILCVGLFGFLIRRRQSQA